MHLTKKDWDVSNIISQINLISRHCTSSYNDGFTAFELKKDLYEIQLTVDKALKTAPKFTGEQEWLTSQEKKRIINILKSCDKGV